MKTQFDDPLPLRNDHRRITATGSFEWAPGDANHHCRISVRITQGTMVGAGHTGNYGTNDDTWECDVDAPNNGQWQLADVSAHGEAEMSSPPPADNWPDQTVSLQLA
jgi:hypothetical protein